MKVKVIPVMLTAVIAMGMLSTIGVNAEPNSPTPTEKITIDSDVIKAKAFRSASIAPMILGANLEVTDYVADITLDIFASDWNINPNQYLYNYRVNPNQNQNDVVKISSGLSTSIVICPCPICSCGSSGAVTQDCLAEQLEDVRSSYDLFSTSCSCVTLQYRPNSIDDLKQTMSTLAEAMTAEGEKHGYSKVGLYGNPQLISDKYSQYIDKTVSYINSHVSEGNKKTVAILSKNANGQYVAYTASYHQGTAVNRAAEYLATTTKNIAYQVTDSTKIQDNGNGSYTILDNSILSNVDAFVLTAFQGSNMTAADLTGFTQKAGAVVFDSMPQSSYGIFMNSVENALGMVSMIMGIYGGTPGVDVTVEDAVAYYYSNFYHIKPAYIDDLANAHFCGKFNYSTLTSDTAASTAVSNYAAIVEAAD